MNEASDRVPRNIANIGQQDKDQEDQLQPLEVYDQVLVRNLTSREETRKLKFLGAESKYHSKEERY